ncbi:AsmA-like C-terminal region-containing protein [Rhodobacteraceae bacterium N5(2021)]|uniref:AsmA-like C-terminal region-containing protein n=1 Tax=Gymnodinialimonas phycosphaerae TaxID=2841589 RepID=A0A975TXN0_9RHOB|nr:AsmA-like C-terminal region-containing protein [Gymnodinialimonas phycosphaerae]MBY4892391.1 AsmA-like C-terminal region-containing protein [Gymnodinialimonas phycosphaerae]
MAEGETQQGRGRRRVVIAVLAIVVFVFVVPVGALWARLSITPMSMPDAVQARIEARINGAMDAGGMGGDVAVGDMVLALPQGGRAPALEFHDVVVTTREGEVRAAFPVLRLRMAPGPLLRGQMRVKRIIVAGAGVNMTRSADGRVDLDFAGAAPGDRAERTVVETLALLDQMFAREAFSYLEEVLGVDMQVILADAVADRDIRLHGAEVRLTRDDGRITLMIGGELEGSRNAEVNLSLRRDAARGVTDMGMVFDTLAARDLATASPALAWLDLMRAPIDGQLSAAMADDGTLGALSGALDIGAGELRLPGQEAAVPFTAMQARLSYAPDTRRARFEALRLEGDQLAFQAEGHADVSHDGTVFTGQFALRDIMANPESLFDTPLEIDGAALDLRLTLGETVRVDVGQATLYDDALRVSTSGHLIAAPEGVTLAIDAQLPEIDAPTLLSYWPATAIPNTRWWVAERLQAATARGTNFALRLTPEADPLYELSFDFTDADIRALPAAPPIRGASGFLSLQNDRLSVALDGGGVAAEGQGAVLLAGSRMLIADVSQQGPLAEFDLDLASTVPDLMHVLAGPPFRVLDASGFAPDEIGAGRIVAEASLSTRLLDRTEQTGVEGIDVVASGVVTGYRGDALIAGRVLTSDRITVTLTPDQLAVGGRGALDGVPVTGQWSVLLDPDAPPGSLVEARARIDRAALATFGVALPEWLISGRGAADLTVFLQADSPARLQIRSDLDGIALAIPPLAWSMPAGRTGDFAAEITLGPRPEVRSLTLEGGGLSLDGAVTFTPDGFLNRFSAGRFRLGQWLDVQGGLVGRGTAAPGIEVTGGVLDFRTMPSLSGTGGSGSGDIGPLDIRLNTMQITEGISLTDLRASLDGASMSGEFRGLVNGGAQVNGQLVPSANGPSVRLQSRDGGAVLRSADIFENLHGGTLDLILAARLEAGQYDGRLTIEGPRLRDASVMAELLNLISVVGLLDQLSGDGINLGDVNGSFRITPQTITVQEGTAVGPSMGFSMDGVYDVASQRYEMQGVVSPFYIVNGLFGALFAPRREGLFGFNYRLIGDSEDVRVSVNPLSILTPGVFREIFRAPPPDFSQ